MAWMRRHSSENLMAKQAPLAFLLHGYLGVGKTTLARRLEEEHAAILDNRLISPKRTKRTQK
jgi:tRNA A37 threonylcarbamoyladenosine biosynthesis protein TsaE